MRTKELTLPGFYHDVCAAIHPLALASPFFRSLDLTRFGLEWVHPSCPFGSPDDDPAVLMERTIEDTAQGLGAATRMHTRLLKPFVRHWQGLVGDLPKPQYSHGHASSYGAAFFSERVSIRLSRRALFP